MDKPFTEREEELLEALYIRNFEEDRYDSEGLDELLPVRLLRVVGMKDGHTFDSQLLPCKTLRRRALVIVIRVAGGRGGHDDEASLRASSQLHELSEHLGKGPIRTTAPHDHELALRRSHQRKLGLGQRVTGTQDEQGDGESGIRGHGRTIQRRAR